VAVEELVAGGFAEAGVTDHDRDDVACRRHHRQARLRKTALQCRGAFLMTLAFDLALFQVPDAGERADGECGRQTDTSTCV
jgi:hypothetical protein